MIGKVVGEYRVTDYLGSGFKGDVYKARHLTLDLTVAIKFIREVHLADEAAKKQFHRGTQALAALDHPNICRFYGAGETPEGRVYLVMSFCEGESLQARIARGRFAIREALEVARDIAAGLAHAHKRHVIHRDIKPANLMFDKDGVIKIVDFDLAKVIDPAISSSGTAAGTPLYMAPEQLNSDCVDGRADLFSLGDVLYEMLTGTHPFQAATLQTVMYRVCNDYPKPLAELLPDAGEDLQEVINRALQKDPQARYQAADEMRENLQTVLDGGELKEQRKRWPKRKWIAATASVMVAAVVVWVVWHPGRATPPIGIAVFAAEQGAGEPEERALVNGFSHDLTDRIRIFARDNSFLWAVSPDRIKNVGLRSPDRARDLVGANLAITVRAVTITSQSGFELQSYHVASPAVEGERVQVDLAQEFESEKVDESLRHIIGLESGSAIGGYTAEAAAYRDYLIGLGRLDERPPALDRAIRSLERAVGADSMFARAWAALGDGYRLQFVATKDSTWSRKSELASRRGLATFSTLPEAFVTIGQLHAARNQPDEAIKSYQAALAIDPRNNAAQWKIADVHLAAGHLEQAEAAYKAATVANPDDASAYERLGYFYYSHERYDEAIAPFSKQSRLEPLFGQAYNYLGACYFAKDCWDDAITMFTRSFDLGRSYVACANLGTLYYMNHKFDDAARMYKWAYEYDETSYRLLGFLAAAYFWIPGERDHAKQLYGEATVLAETARQATPDDPYLLSILSGYYAISRSDSAEAMAERAVQLAPNDAEVLFEVSMTYEYIGQREKALLFLRRCITEKYSLRHIESEPFLEELRKDPRFTLLANSSERRRIDCGQRH
jgi:tetratricopeptide (TPR) repeat protein/tRNA A-37 threonylcarbamoyl transferase component Bud32